MADQDPVQSILDPLKVDKGVKAAAWDAFVQEFRDNSEIASETRACISPP